MNDDDLYVCAGICRVDDDSGCCIGCGRPTYPASSVPTVPEPAVPAPPTPIIVDWRSDSIEPFLLREALPNPD